MSLCFTFIIEFWKGWKFLSKNIKFYLFFINIKNPLPLECLWCIKFLFKFQCQCWEYMKSDTIFPLSAKFLWPLNISPHWNLKHSYFKGHRSIHFLYFFPEKVGSNQIKLVSLHKYIVKYVSPCPCLCPLPKKWNKNWV